MIDASTPVTMTVKQLGAGVIATVLLIIGGLWAVLSFTIGGLRDDVVNTRQSIQVLQVADKDGAIHVRDTEIKLIEQISGLRTDIAGFSGKLDSTNNAIAGLNRRMDDVQKQVAARQAAFNDPKSALSFVQTLKNAGLDDNKVVVVPYGFSGLNATFPK
jgi:hypothetical protein